VVVWAAPKGISLITFIGGGGQMSFEGAALPTKIFFQDKENEMNKIMSFIKSDKGATMAEYAVIAVLIIIIAIAAWTLLGQNITAAVNRIAGAVGGA
jgi:Flp pilus assembly pilin Flp